LLLWQIQARFALSIAGGFFVLHLKKPAPVLALLLAAVAMLVAACGNNAGSSSGGVVQLNFWSFNQQIVDQAAAFNATHANIHVTATKEPSGFGQYYPKVLAAIKAGNAPDVALIEYQYVPTFVSRGALVDLTPYGANDVKSQFDPFAWSLESINGAFYGYPQDTGPEGLFYNAQTFQKAGITTPPATWDDYYADAVKIHALGPKYYISAFSATNTGWFQALMWQAGALWFSTSNNSWVIDVNSPAAQKVAAFWDKLIKQGLVDTATADGDFQGGWATALDHGTIASWVSAVWGQGSIKSSAADTKGQWAVAAMPQWTAGNTDSAFWGGSGISVIAGTKHPKEAAEFAQWYLTNTASLNIGVQQIGWYASNLQARQQALTTPDPFFAGTTTGGQVVDKTFASVNIPAGWEFPPDLDAVTNFQGNDFNTAITTGQTLVSALPEIQNQIISDLTSLGITATAGS
jgi:multiple sugar transport system substrate-binding protein